MAITLCVFDAYGTLFDVTSAARRAAAEPGGERLGEVWPRLAETWRQKQLAYTWLLAASGGHADFAAVTEAGLDYALEAEGIEDAGLRTRLLALYGTLDAYPEAPAALGEVHASRTTAILSNGTPALLAAAVASAGIAPDLDAVLSVADAGAFKPARAAYDLVGQHFGTDPRQVFFVSANGWDAAAATGYGFTALWVNRARVPMDRLPWQPAHVLPDLAGLPGLLAAL